MRNLTLVLCSLFLLLDLSAKSYFVATDGNDTNEGTITAPFASLAKAQSLVVAGDTVFIRGGEYRLKDEQIMEYSGIWGRVFKMDKPGTSSKKICYWGYKNERPVFNLSDVKPADKRVIVFYVSSHYLHFKNFDIIGTQVTITGHTQSECFRNEGGNNNIYENIAMHDGMAIGFYLTKGMNNLVLNCDAYNNYDPVSGTGAGGNVDGFGGHSNSAGSIGNVFRGCRAWYNSDDGFDLISAVAPYTIDSCWAFLNGYKPDSFTSAGDGTGFKAGGYGMSSIETWTTDVPVHKVSNSIAYYNKNKGFYANHHLGGIEWYNNIGYKNPSNFCMLNRKSKTEIVDVPGYGHTIVGNISHSPRTTGKHIIDVNEEECTINNNTFLPINFTLTDADFMSVDNTQLTRARKADGSLPDITFLKPAMGSVLYDLNLVGSGQSVNYDWLQEPAIVTTKNIAKIVGADVSAFTNFYINGNKTKLSEGVVNIIPYSGEISLKATTEDGSVMKLQITK